jgi:hypothetical protein
MLKGEEKLCSSSIDCPEERAEQTPGNGTRKVLHSRHLHGVYDA